MIIKIRVIYCLRNACTDKFTRDSENKSSTQSTEVERWMVTGYCLMLVQADFDSNLRWLSTVFASVKTLNFFMSILKHFY